MSIRDQSQTLSGVLRLLHMVSELDTERYASEDVRPPKGVNCEIHVSWRGE